MDEMYVKLNDEMVYTDPVAEAHEEGRIAY